MEINLVLRPEVEAQLLEQAKEKGLSLELYLQIWIETHLAMSAVIPSYQSASITDWVNAFTTWAKSHPVNGPILSEQSISRESIYSEREDKQL
ncbi:MAG: hypothetical protein SNJ68_12125 [Cyanobacteriota bacterium]